MYIFLFIPYTSKKLVIAKEEPDVNVLKFFYEAPHRFHGQDKSIIIKKYLDNNSTKVNKIIIEIGGIFHYPKSLLECVLERDYEAEVEIDAYTREAM